MRDLTHLRDSILELHRQVREDVVAATERHQVDVLSAVDRDHDGDTIRGG